MSFRSSVLLLVLAFSALRVCAQDNYEIVVVVISGSNVSYQGTTFSRAVSLTTTINGMAESHALIQT